jgi:hypothetical protein
MTDALRNSDREWIRLRKALRRDRPRINANRISGKADFLRRPAAPQLWRTIAQSSRLATAARDAKVNRGRQKFTEDGEDRDFLQKLTKAST